ncbi:MAG: cytochrome C biogenesis protein [Gammaproteobacteria bacterium RIFCSPHIGHO2_12_FULL_41_20]|nr:MAG: cytochrome C biogenesis protein [Gammaproteobacteria bacterium RIFCSPHIGHO2_12_FULL_41_20]
MPADIINIVIAFLEGFALIISPCILPILPIILSGSLTGKKTRPLGIIVGFIIAFTMVTLFSRALIEFLHISAEAIRNTSLVILFAIGLIMASTYLTDKFSLLTQRLTRVGSDIHIMNDPDGGFWSGVLFGGLVGIIWTPCAGPILAAVVVQVVLQQTTITSVLVVIAFALGAGLPMLGIALLGRHIIQALSYFKLRAQLFRKILGVIVLLTVIYLAFFSAVELPFFQTNQDKKTLTIQSIVNGLDNPYPAPDIAGIDAWINSPPLSLQELKGKVVLVDFWTYSCINCLRTLPYLKNWYAKYKKQGLVIIGVHSPEFQFEHTLNNVKNVVKKLDILYPIALDNHFVTWRNFHNAYWPAHYLINKNGEVVYTHFGEGAYDITENNIRYLLGIREQGEVNYAEKSYFLLQTPETYLGYARAQRFASRESMAKNAVNLYSYPVDLLIDRWALKGAWFAYPDKVVASSVGAAVKLHFSAKQVYAVMGAPSHAVKVQVLLNGQPITVGRGEDVADASVYVEQNRLYSLVNLQHGDEGVLELVVSDPGVEIYTFTFGSHAANH